jgi:tRNA(Arg) A34 adenosine deaminase TadA
MNIKTKHKKILWNAVEKSRNHNPNNRCSHAAILTVNNKTFVGFNQRKSHPLQKKFGDNEKAIYLHAEIDAIRKGYRTEGNISGAKLYVARTKADGSIGMSSPCEACTEACYYFGVDEVFFTTANSVGQMYV